MCVAGVAVLMCACTPSAPVQIRPAPTSPTTAPDPLALVDVQVIGAWRAAENAFFEAEGQLDGYTSVQLDATFADPELEVVRHNLALQSFDGEIGAGSWDLGHPTVVALGPSESNPTVATVASCIHDTQILVDRATGAPVPGVLGTHDWAGTISQMVVTSPAAIWKLATQTFSIQPDRKAACS